MAKRRKIENELEARACLEEVAKSGTSIREWARARGIDGRSLHAWRVNLSRSSRGASRSTARRKARVSTGSALVEFVPALSARSSSRHAFTTDGASVEFGDDFQDETLRRVLGVLRSC